MWEALALISHKAAKERHWDEAEEDDEEDRPTDDSLGLWAAQTDDQEGKKTSEHEISLTFRLDIYHLI